MPGIVLFCEVITGIAPALHIDRVRFKSAHLVNVIEVEQTGASAARFPALQNLGLHLLSIDQRRDKPEFVGVRVPPVLAKRQL
ncbi:hypothetical protein D3C85_1848600 [compost metagenome]